MKTSSTETAHIIRTLIETSRGDNLIVDQYVRYTILLWKLIFRAIGEPFPDLLTIPPNGSDLNTHNLTRFEVHALTDCREPTAVVLNWMANLHSSTTDVNLNRTALNALSKRREEIFYLHEKVNFPFQLEVIVRMLILAYGLLSIVTWSWNPVPYLLLEIMFKIAMESPYSIDVYGKIINQNMLDYILDAGLIVYRGYLPIGLTDHRGYLPIL